MTTFTVSTETMPLLAQTESIVEHVHKPRPSKLNFTKLMLWGFLTCIMYAWFQIEIRNDPLHRPGLVPVFFTWLDDLLENKSEEIRLM